MLKLVFTLLIFTLPGCFVPDEPRPTVDRQQDSLMLIDQGTILLRQGQLDRAQAAFVVAFQLVPSPAALDGLGSVAFVRGDFAEAEKLFIQAYSMDPNYGVALSNLAQLYELQGRYGRARELYLRAEKLEPRNIRLKNNFAAFRTNQGDPNGAHETFLEAAAIADNPIIEANVKRVQHLR